MDVALMSRLPSHRHFLVRIVATAENPGRNCKGMDESSSAMLTGTRCTTLVKFPVTLSEGNKANCDPLAGAISSTRPCIPAQE